VHSGYNRAATVSRPRCQGARNDGQPCQAPALPQSSQCWAHDPAQAEAAREARARGAAKGNRTRALRAGQPRMDNVQGLVKFTGLVITGVLSQKIPVDVGRCVLYGVGIQKSLIEVGGLQERLEALEALVKDWPVPSEKDGRRRWGR
jgi:hypothetical protein